MKLYLISQEKNIGWDTYDSAVVCAENEELAKRTDPSGYRVWSNQHNAWMFQYADGTESREDYHNSWAAHPDSVTAKYIGEAASDIGIGVVCASFNAG